MPPRKDNLEKRINRAHQFDEEKIPEYFQTIEGVIRSRNTFTETEFSKFQPLFKRPVTVSSDQHQALEKELYSRISPFEPIRIVTDKSDEEGNRKILAVLPPRLNQHHTLNSSQRNSRLIVDTFSNRADDHNPLNTSAEEATAKMMELVSTSVADDASKKENEKLLESAEGLIADAKRDTAVEFYDDEDTIDSIDDFDDDSVDYDDDDELDFDDDDTSLEDLVDDDE